MKNPKVKTVLLSGLFLASAGFSAISSAHDTGIAPYQNIASSLSTARDIFRTSCFSWGNQVHPIAAVGAPGLGEADGNANRFEARIRQQTTAAGRTATLSLFGSTTTSATTAANSLAWTAPISVTQGNAGDANDGVYYFQVGHSGGASHQYLVEFHCYNSANVHTGTGDSFDTAVPTGAGGPGVKPTVDFVRTLNQ